MTLCIRASTRCVTSGQRLVIERDKKWLVREDDYVAARHGFAIFVSWSGEGGFARKSPRNKILIDARDIFARCHGYAGVAGAPRPQPRANFDERIAADLFLLFHCISMQTYAREATDRRCRFSINRSAPLVLCNCWHTVSNFPFAIAMVLHGRFVPLKPLDAIWRERPSWRIRSKSDYNKSAGAYFHETLSIASLFHRPIIMSSLIEERSNIAGHRIFVTAPFMAR